MKYMKPTGMTRPVDNLGRIVIPKELRTSLEINVGDSLEIFTSGDKIVLRKYHSGDIFTGETDDLVEYQGKKVSRNNVRKLAELAGFRITKTTNEFDIDDDINNI